MQTQMQTQTQTLNKVALAIDKKADKQVQSLRALIRFNLGRILDETLGELVGSPDEEFEEEIKSLLNRIEQVSLPTIQEKIINEIINK
jgi:hypothetical protein